MSDDQQHETGEKQFARKLEHIHQQLIATGVDEQNETAPPLLPDNLAGNLQKAEEILNVIERVRGRKHVNQQDLPTVKLAHADTRSDPLVTWERLDITGGVDDPEHPITLGHFEIMRQIGRGGFGLVFLARDGQLNRNLALKIPRPEAVMTDELVSRFMREARAAAVLSHPNIVPVFEAGRAGPVCYIASEYVEGKSLAEMLAEQNDMFGCQQAAAIIATLADALAHAHQRGVLHRDLKPGNVLMGSPPSGAPTDGSAKSIDGNYSDLFPMITDFGLARVTDEQSFQTKTEAILGTPSYMSPEQASGSNADVGVYADIYALGAILYELITGRPPFEGETILQTLRMVQDNEPTLPRRIDPKISRDLEAICLKCLEKSPADRYPDANELNRDLNRFLNHEPIKARTPTVVQRFAKWYRRNPLVASLSAASVLLLFTALVATTVGWFSTTSALALATDSKKEAEKRYLQTKSAVDDYYTNVSENRLLKSPGMISLRKELLTSALVYYQGFVAERADDDELVDELVETYLRIGNIQNQIGNIRESIDNLNAALDLIDRQLESQPDKLKLVRSKAFALIRLADGQKTLEPDPALTSIQAALELVKDRLLAANPVNAEYRSLQAFALSVRSDVLKSVGKTDNAIRSLEEAIEMQLQLASEECEFDTDNRLRLATWRNMLARLLLQTGKLQQAEQMEQLVTTELRSILEQFPNSLTDLDSLGRSLGEQGKMKLMQRQPEKAIEFLKESAEIFEKLLLIHPQIEDYQSAYGTNCSNLGVAFSMLNDLEGAQMYLEKAIVIEQRALEKSPDSIHLMGRLANSRMNLGGCLAQQKQFEEAKTQIIAAFPVYERLVVRTPRDSVARMRLAMANQMVGQLSRDTGDFATALEHLDTALQILRRLTDDQVSDPQISYHTCRTIVLRASTLDDLQRYDDAINDWQSAIAMSQGRDQLNYKLKLVIGLTRVARTGEALQQYKEIKKQAVETEKLDFQIAVSSAVLASVLANNSEIENANKIAAECRHFAIEALERQLEQGMLDTIESADKLRESIDFDAIRGIDDFQNLLDQLEDN